MNNKSKIVDHFKRSVNLTNVEAIQFSDAFKAAKIKKRQFIVEPNFVVKQLILQ